MKALIVEEDIHFGRALRNHIEKFQNRATFTDDGKLAESFAKSNRYDLILLNSNLSSVNSKSLVHEMRIQGLKTPIIIISEVSTVSERIQYLDLGADDYLEKPITCEELMSRMLAVTRRVDQRYRTVYELGEIQFDFCENTLSNSVYVLTLSNKETQLLEYFMINQNIVLSKGQIKQHLWGNTHDFNENRIEVYVSYLRKKLKILNASVAINTVRQRGYCLYLKKT